MRTGLIIVFICCIFTQVLFSEERIKVIDPKNYPEYLKERDSIGNKWQIAVISPFPDSPLSYSLNVNYRAFSKISFGVSAMRDIYKKSTDGINSGSYPGYVQFENCFALNIPLSATTITDETRPQGIIFGRYYFNDFDKIGESILVSTYFNLGLGRNFGGWTIKEQTTSVYKTGTNGGFRLSPLTVTYDVSPLNFIAMAMGVQLFFTKPKGLFLTFELGISLYNSKRTIYAYSDPARFYAEPISVAEVLLAQLIAKQEDPYFSHSLFFIPWIGYSFNF